MSTNKGGRVNANIRREAALERLIQEYETGHYADGRTLVPTGRNDSLEREIETLKKKLNK